MRSVHLLLARVAASPAERHSAGVRAQDGLAALPSATSRAAHFNLNNPLSVTTQAPPAARTTTEKQKQPTRLLLGRPLLFPTGGHGSGRPRHSALVSASLSTSRAASRERTDGPTVRKQGGAEGRLFDSPANCTAWDSQGY